MDRVRMLRDWFEALDADGSGDISVDWGRGDVEVERINEDIRSKTERRECREE